MDPQPSLDAGLLVGREDELVGAQRLALPAPFAQVQDVPCLGLEIRVARIDTAAVLLGTDSVFVPPTPDGAAADPRHQTAGLSVSCHIGHAEPRQRQAQGGRKLARERLDLNVELWGERPEGVRGELSLRGPPSAP